MSALVPSQGQVMRENLPTGFAIKYILNGLGKMLPMQLTLSQRQLPRHPPALQ